MKRITEGQAIKGLIMIIITNDYLVKHCTSRSGWTNSQLKAIGVVTGDLSPTKGWKKRIIGTEITDAQARIFEAKVYANSKRQQKKIEKKRIKDLKNLEKIRAYKLAHGITAELDAKQCIIAMSKPLKNYKKKTKKTKQKQRKKEGFYDSREWRDLRYKALKLHGRQCLCCGAKPPEVVLHVDHVKPRSLYPELELELDNLQILCKDCNLGKSNKDEIDYR